MPELGRLSRGAAASLAGMAPFDRGSGGREGGAPDRAGGRARVRRLLHVAALAAVRCDPALEATHERLTGDGEEREVALVACRRELVTVANALLRREVDWERRHA